MSFLSEAEFVSYSRDGLNLRSALDATPYYRSQKQGSLVGKGFDLLQKTLTEGQGRSDRVSLETVLKSPVEDKTKPAFGIVEKDEEARKTVLGSTMGTILSELV